MKIRTDFVTNSSSSSFSVMTVSAQGEEYYLAGTEDDVNNEYGYNEVEVNDDYFPTLIAGKLVVKYEENAEIDTVTDLMAWLLVAVQYHNIGWSFDECQLLLKFAAKSISAREFINLSRQQNEYALGDIDLSEDMEDDDLRETIIDNFYGYYDIDFDELEPYIEIINIADSLTDIDNIRLERKELRYDEFTNEKELVYPDITELPALEKEAGRKFEKIEYDTEEYWDAVSKWEDVLIDKVWIFGRNYSEYEDFDGSVGGLYNAIAEGIKEGDYSRIWDTLESGDRYWFAWSKYIEGKNVQQH